MKSVLSFFSLLFLLPGLTGLVANAMLSTSYFDTMPRMPEPEENRTVPRTLNGQVVYITTEDDQQLNFMQYYGLRAFWVGVGLGILYLGAMGSHLEQHQSSDDDDEEDGDD